MWEYDIQACGTREFFATTVWWDQVYDVDECLLVLQTNVSGAIFILMKY